MSFAVDIPDENPNQSTNNSNSQLPIPSSSLPAFPVQNTTPDGPAPLALSSAQVSGSFRPADISSFDRLAVSTYQSPPVGSTEANTFASLYDIPSPPEPSLVPNAALTTQSFLQPAAPLAVKPLSLVENAIYSVWLPSSSLSTVLSRLALSETPPDIHLWFTYPFVSSTPIDGDQIATASRKLWGSGADGTLRSRRESSLAPDENIVSQDIDGLRILIKSRCYRAAINLCGRLLNQLGYRSAFGPTPSGPAAQHVPHSTLSLQLWHTRLALLVRCRLLSLADAELAPFADIDRADLFAQFYTLSAANEAPMGVSLVPFAMRLLWAELPALVSPTRFFESLDRLHYIERVCSQMLSCLDRSLWLSGEPLERMPFLNSTHVEDARRVWSARRRHVQYSMANCLVSMKDYSSASSLLSDMLTRETDSERRLHLLKSLYRLNLMMGNVESAEYEYGRFASELPDPQSSASQFSMLVNKGVLVIGRGEFGQALGYFKDAAAIKPDDLVAANNAAVCNVFVGELRTGLEQLEPAINASIATSAQTMPPSSSAGMAVQSSAEVCLLEGALANVGTLFEVESNAPRARKMAIAETLAYRLAGDTTNPVSVLKIS